MTAQARHGVDRGSAWLWALLAIACATLGKFIRPFPEPDLYCTRLLEQDGARATNLPSEGFYTWPMPEDVHADPQVRFDSNGRIVSVWLSSDQTELHRARYNPPWAQE